MRIKYLGHSSFQIETGGKLLVFDPFIRPNALASSIIELSALKADYVLLSHAHQDHTADAEYVLKKNDATLVANWEICSWYNTQGYHKTHPMNTGGEWQFDFGTVKLTHAVHSSSFPDGSYGGNPNGFIISSEGKRFYFAGDTALNLDMKLIGEYQKPDFAFLPIGSNFTMTYQEAIIASGFIQCNQIIGMHYDTFGYIKINHEDVKKAFADAGKTIHLMEIGSSIEL